ncbi:MAG: hypothetical protein K2J60_08785 [Acetatifactor sp.]|nr:hypothetical protein [Acetatifactor sp.]
MGDWTQKQKQLNQQQLRQLPKEQAEADTIDDLALLLDPQMLELQSEDPQSLMLIQQIMAGTSLQPITSDTVAGGTPQQQVAPARKTYKKRRADKRHAREARNNSPVGTIVSYDIKHQLKDYYTLHANSNKSYFASHKNLSGVDERMLQDYAHGFRTNWMGRPATAEDKKYKLEDEAFYDAFCSTDYERRVPYLEKIVDEVLSYNMTKDMFSDESLQNNAAGIKNMAQRLVLLDNLIEDKNNKFFFDKLSSVQWNALGQVRAIGFLVGTLFGAECVKRGVDSERVKYEKSKETIDMFAAQAKEIASDPKHQYKEMLEAYRSMKDIFKEAEVIEQRAALRRNRQIHGKHEKLPEPGFYQEIRSLLEPEVQELLDCDVWNLSDKELLRRSAELKELCTVSLKVDKCLAHKQPGQRKLTLKDDLLGQRKPEYDYKLKVLQGLVEKAGKLEELRAREASKLWPEGNIVTYDIKHQLEDYETQVKNSFDSYFPAQKSNQPESGQPEERDMSKNRSGVDTGVLRFFSHGFRTDEAGRPATEDDEKYKLADEAFYDAFCSENYEKRVPYLQRMVEEVISLDLNEMFSDNSLRSNAAVMKSIAGRMVSMQNVVNDEHNNFFFHNLSSVKKEALKRAMDIGSSYSAAFTAECHQRGVEVKKGTYISKELIEAYSNEEKDYVARYQEKMEHQPVGAIMRAALRRKRQIDMENVWGALRAEGPAPEVYQQIRSFLEPDVQKLLDCDVEKLSKLSDEDLVLMSKDLGELYDAVLDVDKCLTLKYPGQSNSQGKLTLREDLIGQRKLEYEYKAAVLRGLVERAAGFQEQGRQTIEAASTLYQNRKKPGTMECQKVFEYFGRDHTLQSLVFADRKFDDVAEEFTAGTGEMAGAKKRLKQKKYFSLDEEKRIRLGMPKTIGEPLFRSPRSFLDLEAAQTLLTPEEYRKMLLNLGAGAELTPELTLDERKEAIKKNDAGLDTLREVMAAQYDMLERKYGNSIEQLRVRDIMEHFVDIAKDFANIQVDFHMTKCFPGFIRENNPDDERLDNQIRYYNACAFHILDLVPFIGGGFVPVEDITDEKFKIKIDEILKDIEDPRKRRELEQNGDFEKIGDLEKLRNAREALMSDNSFQHPLDWSQKVKKPADTK